jgi:hypothetical protein
MIKQIWLWKGLGSQAEQITPDSAKQNQQIDRSTQGMFLAFLSKIPVLILFCFIFKNVNELPFTITDWL